MTRVELSLPTPSLGDECPCCKGAGDHRRVDAATDPNGAMVERLPLCTTCYGSGAVRVWCQDAIRESVKRWRARSAQSETCTPLPGDFHHGPYRVGDVVRVQTGEHTGKEGTVVYIPDWSSWTGTMLVVAPSPDTVRSPSWEKFEIEAYKVAGIVQGNEPAERQLYNRVDPPPRSDG